jgi:membrane associated rhomboid family serine protease
MFKKILLYYKKFIKNILKLSYETINNRNAELNKFLRSLIIPVTFVVLLWAIHFSQTIFNLPFAHYGILPRKISGLVGILSAPLVHANYSHLISNTPTLLILSVAVMYFYPTSSLKALTSIYFLTNIFVWLFARQVYHVGASGIIYGLLGFLFFSGVFRRDNRSIALSLLVTFIYGGLIWGILPGLKGISWESHLFGGISGVIVSFVFRKDDPYIRYEWEEEEETEGDEN